MRKVAIVDIDGTVADCSHRRHWVSPELHPGDKVKIRNTNDYAVYIRTRREPDWEWPMYDLKLKDGTEVTWQTQSVKKVKRWDKFFEEVSKDPPIPVVIDTVLALHAKGYPIIFCSGRPEKTRQDTLDWLANNRLSYLFMTPKAEPVKGMKGLYHDRYETKLLMRPDNDTREDYIVKQEIYERDIKPFYDVFCVFDDRDQVVKLWRSLGLICFQVAEGNF